MEAPTAQAIVVIPARFASTRFPGKPLAKIWGRPMIQWVYERSHSSGLPCWVVTDDERIENAVVEFGGQCWRVDDPVSTGSERVALALARYFSHQSPPEFVINVQGDEPLIEGDCLKSLVRFHRQSTFDITTLVKKQIWSDEVNNPNIVKALYSPVQARCLTFSRAALPYFRQDPLAGMPKCFYQHVGVYCYRLQALQKFIAYAPSPLEQIEQLEQLRALENGLTIGALETNINLIGVDIPADIKKVEERTHG